MNKPYYQDDLVTLYHGDCLEITDWLAADVMVTDPPYGIKYSSGQRFASPKSSLIFSDDSLDVRDTVISMWSGPALVFGTWKRTRPLGISALLIWDKGACPGMGDLTIPWGLSFEEIYVIGRGFMGPRGPGVLRVTGKKGAEVTKFNHPTPKPVDLMAQLIRKCPPGVIADPFVGSGTTLVAAKGLGRRAIGIEIEERYCEIAAKRLAQDYLFGEVEK